MTLAHRPVAAGVLLLLLLLVLAVMGCDRPKPPISGGADSLPPPGVDTAAVADTAPKDTVPDDEAWREEGEYEPSSEDAAPPPSPSLMAAAAMPGLPVGPSAWPEDKWCSGFISATTEGMNYEYWPRGMADADKCNIRIVSPIPRKYYTENGKNVGTFSPTKAKATIDKLAKILNALPSGHRDNLVYVSILDDMGCDSCWPPAGITPAQTAELTRYARSKFPSWVAVGLRIDPIWMAKSGITTWGVDVAVMQWHRKKGPKNLTGTAKQRGWYEEGRLAAPRVGVKRINYAVNVLKCEGGGNEASDSPCGPTELEAHVGLAINFDPATNCGSLSWRWDSSVWTPAYQDVWRRLVAFGASKPRQACKA